MINKTRAILHTATFALCALAAILPVGSVAQSDGASSPDDSEIIQLQSAKLSEKLAAAGGLENWRKDIAPFIAQIRTESKRGKIVRLRDDYLASSGNLSMISTYSYVYADRREESLSPAFEILRDTCGQLQDLGARVLVAVVPTRSALVPEAFFEPETLGTDLLPAYTELLLRLGDEKIETVDLMTPLLNHIQEKGPVYLKTDHHWNADGIACAARVIAEQINLGHIDSTDHNELELSQKEVNTVYRGSYFEAAPESLRTEMNVTGRERAYRVSYADGQGYKDIDSASILIVGDSFVGHFSNVSAGISAHLAKATLQPVSSLWRGSGGPLIPRMLQRAGTASLSERSVIVILFASHYMTPSSYTWTPSDLKP